MSGEAARALLTVGFAGKVTNYINEALRKHVDSLIALNASRKKS